MAQTVSRANVDAWIAEDAAAVNHGGAVRLWLRNTASSKGRRGLIFFAKPFPHNNALVVIEATLKVYLRGAWPGSTTITVTRITEAWHENRVTWANQPAVTTTSQATATVPAGVNNDLVEIDVTDIMQDVAAGGAWFGFRLVIDADSKHGLHSSDGVRQRYHPRLAVEWGLRPYPPSNLEPRGGDACSIATPTLCWRFSDHSNEAIQSASQVQISDSADFGTVVYDSGKRTNEHHRWNLAGETSIPDGAERFWRVKVWDATDLGSGWSNPARFQRQHQGTLTITNPGVGGTVNDLTPTIRWTFTGRTQDRIRMRILEILPNGDKVERYQHSDHKNNTDHLTVPQRDKARHPHPIIKSGKNYRVQLYAWDTINRVGLPRDPAYVFAQRDFIYVRGGPDPVPTLTAELFGPGIVFTWNRAVEPDWFCLTADGEEIIHRIEPSEFATETPNEYRLIYWEAPPREEITYEIEAVETIAGDRRHSSGNDFATKTTDPEAIWLIDDDADESVIIEGDDSADFSIGETGTTYQLVGNRRPVRITDSIRGYEGSISGLLANDNRRDTFLRLKGRSYPLRLVAANLNIPVFLEEASVSPMPIPTTGDQYEVGFSFFQVGEFFDLDEEPSD